MAKETPIEWADSTLNAMAGCTGCELWNGKVKKCYAGVQTDGILGRPGRAGFPGWPKRFAEPVLFLDRIDPALKWKDLTGSLRDEKPWLNGYPRLIFFNDMGDTFTHGLPSDWLAPLLPRMAASPHQFLLLTKRPSKAVEFSNKYPFPDNFWIGTTITNNLTKGRAAELRKVKGGRLKFLSVEPIWEDIDASVYEGMQWAIFGGESGKDPTATPMDAIMKGVNDARAVGCTPFVKQLGAKPYFNSGSFRIPFHVKDSHGGDMSEWPEALRIREMPAIAHQGALL